MAHKGEVLVIEDHLDIAELVCSHLESQGFSVDYAADGEAGLHLGCENAYDAVVLDLMLPGIDGLEVCSALRAARRDVPVLMLTARDTLNDKLAGFDSGADDYLIKPFDLAELEARLLALIRRKLGKVIGGAVLSVGDLALDLERFTVTRGGRAITLTPIGMKILAFLMQHSPRVVDRSALEREVWGDLPPDSDALRSHMYLLRKAVDKPFPRALIHTVHSAGFRISDEG